MELWIMRLTRMTCSRDNFHGRFAPDPHKKTELKKGRNIYLKPDKKNRGRSPENLIDK